MTAETLTQSAEAVSSWQYWVAAGIFICSYGAILSEKVHKTKAVLLGASLMMVGPILTQNEAFHSRHFGIDYNVIFLLIGMMMLVNIAGKSGMFEWAAIKLAQLSRGRPFTIMVWFVLLTAVASAFLDNVTTVLLMAPVTLFIADEQDIDPIPFLIAEAMASNIGGTATLIGDPPNLIIGSRANLGFMAFIENLGPPVLVMLVALLIVLWFVFHKKLSVDKAKQERIMAINPRKLIRDPRLVKLSVVVLGITILGFCFHGLLHIEPATIALCGASILLLLSKADPHEVFTQVEWPTVFFFIGLFIIVGGVVKVGVIEDLSYAVVQLTGPNAESMKTTAIVMLWFSGIFSAIVDNIPYVATMAPLVQDIAGSIFQPGQMSNQELLHHPVLMPVWWSLALGACLGGNGTPVGASANLIILGIAEKNGHKVSFLRFMAYGIPIMFLTLAIATVYVLLRFY